MNIQKPQEVILKIDKVCFSAKNNNKKILNNFSLTVKQGDFLIILGPNGAGKSSFMNLLSGNIIPDSGRILFEKTDISNVPSHKRSQFISRVCQNPSSGTFGNLTIAENLSIALNRTKRRSFKFALSKSKLEIFSNHLKKLDIGLENRLNDPVDLLSGGQRQALSLIMSSIQSTKILLLDEHTAALDPKMVRKIINLTKSIISDNSLTAIMITHSLDQAINLGSHIIIIREGKVYKKIDKKTDEVSIEQLNKLLY